MISNNDLYVQTEEKTITFGESSISGRSIVTTEVLRFVDVRNLTQQEAYLVTCTHRILLNNPDLLDIKPDLITSFNDYPALFSLAICIKDETSSIETTQLVDYFPKTVNTAVTTSQSNSSNKSNALSKEHSSGSTTSQTNSFGISVSGGVMGDVPIFNAGANYENSSTSSSTSSAGISATTSAGSDTANSNSMSIKDWSLFASSHTSHSVNWTASQEFPWNVLDNKNGANSTASSIVEVDLPEYIIDRLFDTNKKLLFPPSELSRFGVDFTFKAKWLIKPKKGTAISQKISLNHQLHLISATHSKDKSNNFIAQLTNYPPVKFPSTPTAIDMALLALSPLTSGSNAIIGFVKDEFEVLPDENENFSIRSNSNDLLIEGTGLKPSLDTDFSKNGKLTMTVDFKVTENRSTVDLLIKHWVSDTSGCKLALTINNETSITRYVDYLIEGNGDEALTTIPLRYKNFASVDYCDHLKLGNNSIDITITPVESGTNYVMKAMAVSVS